MVHCGSNQWFKSGDSAWILNRLMVEHRGVGSCWRWWEKRILNQSTWISRNGLKIGAAKSVHLSYLDDPTFMLESHFWRGKTGVYLRWLTTTPMRVLFTSNEFRWPCRQIFLKPWPSKWLSIIFAELNAQLLLFGCVWNPEMTITIRKLMMNQWI